jgi:hypothetical protein
MNRDVFEVIDKITEDLFKATNENVDVVRVEELLKQQGFYVDRDIARTSFEALVTSKVQFLQNFGR